MIWCTVPHVTIAADRPRASARKVAPGSRYFPYYTRPWITDERFDPRSDPHITDRQARAVDYAIDLYNDAITAVVERARTGSPARDWYLLDIAGLLDRLASRRYILDPNARPAWWSPYPLPAAAEGARALGGLAVPAQRRPRRTRARAGCSRSTASTPRRSATG